MEEQRAEGFESPTGPSVSPGVVFYAAEAAERGGAAFSERSWEPEDFGADYEQFGRTPPAAATPSSGVLPLRATAIADPLGVRTYATLTLLPSAAMGPPARSPSLGGSSSRPPYSRSVRRVGLLLRRYRWVHLFLWLTSHHFLGTLLMLALVFAAIPCPSTLCPMILSLSGRSCG
ncbi:hypothetical protein LguiB_017833 [Lonicera macranthoides]